MLSLILVRVIVILVLGLLDLDFLLGGLGVIDMKIWFKGQEYDTENVIDEEWNLYLSALPEFLRIYEKDVMSNAIKILQKRILDENMVQGR
jgi:hypothetical protein